MAGNLVGRTFNDRYRITERIGIGGMAEVYRAQDTVLGRVVAVKVMLPQYAEDKDFTVRFRQEASAAANLQSPYIVNVYDWGQDHDSNTYYIVMEYVRGSDLKTAINERGAIGERKVAQIGSQVAQALSVAHHMDIIHRDIKPQNIMIQPDGNIKVMDFGIARAKNSVKNQTSSVLGTAHYISPEQAQGKELTAASDIYSLGVVMYEAVTGQLPFDGPDAVSVAMKQVKDTPAPPSSIVPSIDPALENIIMKCMEKDPAQRFSTALEMRQVLTDYLAGRLSNSFANAYTQRMDTTQQYGSYNDGSTQVMNPVTTDTATAAKATSYNDSNGKKKKSKRTWIILAIILILALVGIGAYMSCSQQQTVPDVSGESLEEAKADLQEAGYSIGTVTEVYSTTVDEGDVVDTDPTAGTVAEEGTRININVSKGTEQVSVPNLNGMTEDEALEALSDAGLSGINAGRKYSSKVGAGLVCSQDPSSNSLVDKGTEVTYYISRGAREISIPDVTGQSESSATSTLNSAGFKVSVTEEASDTVDEGYVISYSPTGSATKDSTITIVVSTGSETEEVPNVTGMTVNKARNTLQNAGYTVYLAADYSNSAIVTSYWPTEASAGSAITLQADDSSDSSSDDSTSTDSSDY